MNEYGDIIDPHNKGPLKDGNCFTRLFFSYGYKVLKLGNKKEFKMDDCWEMKPDLMYGNNYNELEAYLKKNPILKNGLFNLMFKWIFKKWIFVVTSFAVGNFTSIVYPYLLRAIIQWLEGYSKNPNSVGKIL